MKPPPAWPKKGKGSPIAIDGPEAQDVLSALRAGNYVHTACMAAGIGQETFRRWVRLGKLGEEPYASFWRDVRQAVAQAEVQRLRLVEAASTVNWQAAAWMLERRNHKRWGRRIDQKQEVQLKEVRLPHNIDLLEPSEARLYLRTLAKMAEDPTVRAQFEEAAAALEGA
jgi:hypothetical protein